jgi:hypothetical protein
MVWGFNSAHHRPIGRGSSAGDVAGERRQRVRGSTATSAWSPARSGAVWSNVLWYELQGVLGEALAGWVDSGSEQSMEFAGGGNGGKRRRSVLRARREGDGVYRRPRLVKVVVRASSRRMVTTWARCRLSGLVTCGGASPMVRGGATVRRVWARRVAPA